MAFKIDYVLESDGKSGSAKAASETAVKTKLKNLGGCYNVVITEIEEEE
jgi:hypothetical protein